MPARYIVPNWEERDLVTKRWAIINDRIFLTKVVLPVMKHLGTDRAEMRIIRQKIIGRQETVIPNATALIDKKVAEHDRDLVLATPAHKTVGVEAVSPLLYDDLEKGPRTSGQSSNG